MLLIECSNGATFRLHLPDELHATGLFDSRPEQIAARAEKEMRTGGQKMFTLSTFELFIVFFAAKKWQWK